MLEQWAPQSISSSEGSVATLQEWSDKVGRYGPRTLSRRSVQMAPIRTGSHPACGRGVPAVFTVVPRRGGTPCRARPARRSRHGVEVGAALRSGYGTTFAREAQPDDGQLADGL